MEVESAELKSEVINGSTKTSSWVSLLAFDYYQTYFDVSTYQVVERIIAGMVPIRLRLVEKLYPQPDLYGPFWLSITLILVTAVSGNIAVIGGKDMVWEFHFHEVTLIGCSVYMYTWFVPCCLWCFLWWHGNRSRYTLLQMLAIYGYSVSIFIPLVVLWLIRNEIFRWLLWAVCTVSSGSVLVISLWKPLSQADTKLAGTILVIIFVLHAALSAGFKMYYFSVDLAPSARTSSYMNSSLH